MICSISPHIKTLSASLFHLTDEMVIWYYKRVRERKHIGTGNEIEYKAKKRRNWEDMFVEAINRDVCKRNDILHDLKQLPVVMSRATFLIHWFIVNWVDFGQLIYIVSKCDFFYLLVDTFVNTQWHTHTTFMTRNKCHHIWEHCQANKTKWGCSSDIIWG